MEREKTMENKLKKLFDYQRFEKNEKLEKLIQETENAYVAELSDDALSFVNAAGEPMCSKAIGIGKSTTDAEGNGSHGAGVSGG